MADNSAKVWTVLEIIKWSENFLKTKGFDNPRTDAELMLMDVLNMKRMDLYVNFDRPLEKGEREKMKAYILRRAAQEPVQYITGNTFFMGLPFKVTPDVLIPRFDTEVLIETVLKNISQYWKAEPLTIIDIGTGSGAIAVALAKFTTAKIIAVDISAQALSLAEENARYNGLAERIEFVKSDLLTGLAGRDYPEKVIIVSNPPYVTPEEYEKLPKEIKDHEPKQALLAGCNGLEYYQKIVEQMQNFTGKICGCFFEIGCAQGAAVKELLEKYLKNPANMVKDIGRNDRVVYTIVP